MIADDRVLLLDLENLGAAKLKPRPLRARLEVLLTGAGAFHHAVAAYAAAEGELDPVASVLAEFRVAPLRVLPGPDAAELALLAHARHVHAQGGRIFLVGSADGKFTELVALGRVELLVWEQQPVAAKLADVVHAVHRLPRPGGASADDPIGPDHATAVPATAPAPEPVPSPDRAAHPLGGWVLAGLMAGLAAAAGQRLLDLLVPRRSR